ncbi:hypothetical protein ACFE04_031401 [Oxalis oulophora]
MAMTGSFSVHLAVRRFLDRCPELATLPQFAALVNEVEVEVVVNSMAELFLHPKYTIPLVGCFRPIIREIVQKTVSLLQLVPNLRSHSTDLEVGSSEEVLDDSGVVYVIEFYVKSGRVLDLHELACLAFCRALDLAPFLLGHILTYFKVAPPPFFRILNIGNVSELSIKAVAHCLSSVRTSYRFLVLETEVFTKIWDWSCYLVFPKQTLNCNVSCVTEFEEHITDLRWCSMQILSIIFKMDDRAIGNLIGAKEGLSCLLRWEEFCQDTVIEKAGSYIGSCEVDECNVDNILDRSKQSFDISFPTLQQFDEDEPSSKSRRLLNCDERSCGSPFFITSNVEKCFEMVILAVSQKWPVLLYGPAGVGKSALISKLAYDSGNQVLSIHMDDQIDAKTLVGSYVCTEQPGEFKWQPGSLTQAVLDGFWVVIEDVDKAPSDVLSVILPLLEGSSMFVTGLGKELRVADNFRLFSTVSTFKSDISHSIEGGNSLSVLWRKVMIEAPSKEDLKSIVKAWYPTLEPLAGKLVDTFENVRFAPMNQNFASLSRFSLRDLLKWCKRIARLNFSITGTCLSADERHSIFQEAVDIFASSYMSAENRLSITEDLAKMWVIPVSETSALQTRKRNIQDSGSELKIGRVVRQRRRRHPKNALYDRSSFVELRCSLQVLEKIACSVEHNEPVLLVGETGIGKTTLVQNLAKWLGEKLTVLNLSQQSDVADLIGGFKPVDARSVCTPLYNDFEGLLVKTISLEDNAKFLEWFKEPLRTKSWKKLLTGLKEAAQKFIRHFRNKPEKERHDSVNKRKKPFSSSEVKLKAWEDFHMKVENTLGKLDGSSGMAFSFVEGSFVTALKSGEWILLDEVNLAPPETLQRIVGVLEGDSGSLCLAERGDVSSIHRDSNFRIFACMNPATDAGKRDLPLSLRSRFTEYFVDDKLEDDDLGLFIDKFMGENQTDEKLKNNVKKFYEAAKKASEERLQDGANQKPQFSLRSLYRALEYIRKAERKFELSKAIYDGFSMFFLTLLDRPSALIMRNMIVSNLLGGKQPAPKPFFKYLAVREGNNESNDVLKSYVLTKSVEGHLSNLASAIFIKRYPVLLQGPTSSGKTSLVQYLAAFTGHKFVRINNHEHTDLQEYLGSYITDAHGKLVFNEGVLVEAVRKGYWIVLDELNLAPSDVLEALNRLLDDNRELFVPELQETIRAHPDFMLFATQNPPTNYGGRKMLSRAFRNRFVEIHVDEIPENELSTILEKKCLIPGSYAKVMVEVMKELQIRRTSSKVFAGKHGYITPRDLFRWANRFTGSSGMSYGDLAIDGYYLLAERLRDDDEKNVVIDVLKDKLGFHIKTDELYREVHGDSSSFNSMDLESLGNIIWTDSMRRLYFLVKRCHELREPVLLVGETAGGKTSVCQLLSIALGLKLHILNCHQYTETSDFLGGFYPIRDRSKLISEFKELTEQLMQSKAYVNISGHFKISSDIAQASLVLNHLHDVINKYRQSFVSCTDDIINDLSIVEETKSKLSKLYQTWQTIFTWQDGPLVQAMKGGDLFLVDEVSLADDSVLERLNSVLEPERKLTLAEKGGPNLETIIAGEKFLVLATMNPSGDFGKKELSPALRNRFTEIWVPPVSDLHELGNIATARFFNKELSYFVAPMLKFWEWFNKLPNGKLLTVRDLLSWVAFINHTESSLGPEYALVHGLFLILLDGLSLGTSWLDSDFFFCNGLLMSGTSISGRAAEDLRKECLAFLLKQLIVASVIVTVKNVYFLFIIVIVHGSPFNTMQIHKDNQISICIPNLENYGWGDLETMSDVSSSDDTFGINPFYIKKGNQECEAEGFVFLAPTTRRNVLRVLRALQLPKPVLLEGSPGVGKTSLVVALGKYSGHKVVRINLSEQTDMMDLLGSDLPVESNDGMKFAWSDGILLQALKEGCWVLLDELNLAPQSVLEGLNAILDHRAEVFIPELGRTFKCPSSFRVFACQNPCYQGGGRKGLPKSFLNRFTKVYVDELVNDDYLFICSARYPSIPRPLLSNLILFNKRLHEDTMIHHKFAQNGSPWEFNLRDVMRSCDIIEGAPEKSKLDCFLNLLYVQRMRTAADRKEVVQLYEDIFGVKPFINPYPRVQVNSSYIVVGANAVKRNYYQATTISNSQLKILPWIRHTLEAAAQCLRQQWLCLLIGPPSSGKTSLIRLLAQLSGNVLNELNLSSATDISDLLGCFEQYDAFRKYRLAVARLEPYFNEYYSSQFCRSSEEQKLLNRWLSFLSNSSTSVENWSSIGNSIPLLVKVIEELILEMKKNDFPVTWSVEDLCKTMETLLKLQKDLTKPHSAKFEWVSGMLIKAIENGEWIVLENANLCSPTVLDRINSLVEQCGTITVNECGIIDGKPVVFQPHPNFRMFLTVNPFYGEVSRAMRNRGVEIFMMPPNWLLDEKTEDHCDDIELEDVKRFLVSQGIPLIKLVDSMAKAHIYAKNEGLRLNLCITYLELARWVQLFQQLLKNGEQPLWSLQISWEHTYLSSLGEAEGRTIVSHAKIAYLSIINYFDFDCLTLPGGWPRPLRLRDLVWYSKEVTVQQNCMYLEFLGAQFASRKFGADSNKSDSIQPYLINTKMLKEITLPTGMLSLSSEETEFDFDLESKKLFFAANWTIEQATESDIDLYISWFNWFSSKLQPYCTFFDSYLRLLKGELKHPIWKDIIYCRKNLVSLHQVDLNAHPIPMLSLELVDLNGMSEYSRKLHNAVNCIRVLRLSLKQWSDESECKFSDQLSIFLPFLSSLRVLEEESLKVLLDSSSFDELIQLYIDLLEDHTQFWRSVCSYQHEHISFYWLSLLKRVRRLQNYSPEEVERVLIESKNLEEFPSWHLSSEESLLWVYAGHPVLPSSAILYHKQHQLLELCQQVWPTKKSLCNEVDVNRNEVRMEAVATTIPELRFLAVKVACVHSYLTSKVVEDDTHVASQLEENYQMLFQRIESEKNTLAAHSLCEEDINLKETSTCCRILSPETLCGEKYFECWQDTLPIVDSASFFMNTELLQHLSSLVLLDPSVLLTASDGVSNTLKSALKYALKSVLEFSLTFSSRPPQFFTPHQKVLEMLDGQTASNSVNAKINSYVHEMWFGWHSSLWSCNNGHIKSFSKFDGNVVQVPDILFQPVKTATVTHILKSTFVIKDHSICYWKLQLASSRLWQDPSSKIDIPDFLLSTARCLFRQIMYAHKNSFDSAVFSQIEEILSSYQRTITHDDAQVLSSLIVLTKHRKLKSLVHTLIEPLLGVLNISGSSTDLHYKLGCAWLRVGELRYNLLLCCDEVDPVMKYSLKYSQAEDKILSLEHEIKVREECDYLAGCISSTETERKRAETLEELKARLILLKEKIVFRPHPKKFRKLKDECAAFLKFASSLTALVHNIDALELQKIIDQTHNFQVTATSFIDRLSDEYTSYTDVIQPVQVAIQEMKLGLSLVLSRALQKSFMNSVKEDNMDGVMDSIYSFMRFPRGLALEPVSLVGSRLSKNFTYLIDFPANSSAFNMSLLEKLAALSSDVNANRKVSFLQLKAISHHIATAQVIDRASFMSLDNIFHDFASIWISMKEQVKSKEESDSQQYKFRARVFKVESVLEVDISTLTKSISHDTSSEFQELLRDEEDSTEIVIPPIDADKESESLEEEWSLMQETILNNIVNTHNQLFGSADLFISPGHFEISNCERLQSFIGSYTLGVEMIKGFNGIHSSSLDSKLLPEHLLRLCLEHEQKLNKPPQIYKFYKDPNVSVMARMVKPVANIQHRISSFLVEWEDHPGLQKLLEVTQMLLDISISTPLAKALPGLQFLVHKSRSLQENDSKFYLSDLLEPIVALVCSWQEIEFRAWPALLDEVEVQFEKNAAEMWFPLYGILVERKEATDIIDYRHSSFKSLEEFIQTSSIGDFKKRLQLLLSFHGQISVGRQLGLYSGSWQEENLNILYNVFGFYMQFLPIILEHIKSIRTRIEKELKDHLKLCRWERLESIEYSKRSRHKLKKIINKYTAELQQPAMLILVQQAVQRGFGTQNSHGPKLLNDFSDNTVGVLTASLEVSRIKEEERPKWCIEWKKKADDALENLCVPLSWPKDVKETVSTIKQCIVTHSTSPFYQKEWTTLKDLLEDLSKSIIEKGDCWKTVNVHVGKRTLTDLLKQLENIGLSKHKSEILEVTGQLHSWLCQPSYDIHHVLLARNPTSNESARVASGKSQHSTNGSFDAQWKEANEYYFKTVASRQFLAQVSQERHGDITSEQASRAVSFVDHLVVIEQNQRSAAYDFAKQLNHFENCVSALKRLLPGSPADDTIQCLFADDQYASFKRMWQQKQLFDSLSTTLFEESLLLSTVSSTHLNSCDSIKPAANRVLSFIEKYIPVISKSKESLDYHLLGHKEGLTTMDASRSNHFIISKEMENLLDQNSNIIKEFEDVLGSLSTQDLDNKSKVTETLLCHFTDILKKFDSAKEPRDDSRKPCEEADHEVKFCGALKNTYEHIMVALKKLCSFHDDSTYFEESSKITSLEFLFNSPVKYLSLDNLCDKLLETIYWAEKLVKSSSTNATVPIEVGCHLKHLHTFADQILNFGEKFLQDFVAMHKTVTVMTHVLANVLAFLFLKGYGIKESEDSEKQSQEASGTGMGEGVGRKDVSDQIDDEDQLLGAQKQEEQENTTEVPNKNEKGIEMDQDFEADALSVSEESGQDSDEDDTEEQVESAMGETGDNGEVVDEKHWNKEEDEIKKDENEKYESGQSVKEHDNSCSELRAKEDSDDIADENGDPNSDETENRNDEKGTQDQDGLSDEENVDMNLDKDEAFTDATGLKLDESKQDSEENTNNDDMEIDEEGNSDSENENPEEENNENVENGLTEEEMNPTDENMEDVEGEKQVDGNPERDNDQGQGEEENPSESDLTAPKKDNTFEQGISDFDDQMPNMESATQPNHNNLGSDSKNLSAEDKSANDIESHDDPRSLQPSSSDNFEMDTIMADSSNHGKLSGARPKSQLPPQQESSSHKNQPNPNRSLGDALEDWMERVKVSADLQTDNLKEQDGINDENENADEFGFVPQLEKGSAQTLGPATSEQVNTNVNYKEPDQDNLTGHEDDVTNMEIEKQNLEELPGPTLNNRIDDRIENSDPEKSTNPVSSDAGGNDLAKLRESIISISKSYPSENISQLSIHSSRNDELIKLQDLVQFSTDVNNKAAALWRQYELLTTRLSQELAEQLRLVMEPTLASKLQGDYKTGKRINMKRVIPYIASQYRKDKIWLRRTRPNKRDYQVVIAIDDSESMSEARCGSAALEALVTVCRAMSQLEIGNLAVVSFGKKGNIKLLHDFDQSFTGEAGIKMISNLTFEQENTIEDEPVGELLLYLNGMLNSAVAKARLPSGQNPLQQLVLIISDGRFHEMESLKRRVREFESKKRMVAFLILDNAVAPMMTLNEVHFEDNECKVKSYLDSFPFPYYCVLGNIEELPRTLAGSLRQWFELMQSSRDQ